MQRGRKSKENNLGLCARNVDGGLWSRGEKRPKQQGPRTKGQGKDRGRVREDQRIEFRKRSEETNKGGKEVVLDLGRNWKWNGMRFECGSLLEKLVLWARDTDTDKQWAWLQGCHCQSVKWMKCTWRASSVRLPLVKATMALMITNRPSDQREWLKVLCTNPIPYSLSLAFTGG